MQFWFDFGSTYSYVAALRVEDECARAGLEVEYRPFLLGPIFTGLLGIKDSPFNAQPVRGRYMWRDLERLCEKYALPWRRPTVFPRNSLLAARVACCAGTSIGPLTRAIFRANFVDDRDIAHPLPRPSMSGRRRGARGRRRRSCALPARATHGRHRRASRAPGACARRRRGSPRAASPPALWRPPRTRDRAPPPETAELREAA